MKILPNNSSLIYSGRIDVSDPFAIVWTYPGTFVKNEMADIYSRELIELLFEQPYCKISFLVNRHIAKKQTASKYLTD